MNRDKKPLYRKVNTRAAGVRHVTGGDFKQVRNKKKETREMVKGTMAQAKHRGLDYTPLFQFLISKVGQLWETVFKEAIARLDKPDPIFWLVATNEDTKKEIVRVGESSYFSGLFVDNAGILQLTNPTLQAVNMVPFCTCCTHTFNGKVFGTE
ncbi:MAG: hypothetical protein ACK4R6_04815 [Spirosomataceae bacterium]